MYIHASLGKVYLYTMKDTRAILSYLSDNLNGYESTTWLKAENELLNGLSPADMILDGEAKKVGSLLPKEIKRIKAKKKQKKA